MIIDAFIANLALVGIVLIVACLLSGVLDRSGIPVVAVFLALGAALGPYGLGLLDIGFHSPALHVLATLGLVLVLFSDAVTLQLAELRAHRHLLLRVLGPGTALPAALTALAAWLLLDVPVAAAAILGAALASTDPVLLRAVLRSRSLPPAAQVALRIETGMNDVVLLPVVVIASLVLRSHASGSVDGMGTAVLTRSLLGLFVLGPLFGAFVGWAGITALAAIRRHYGVRRDYESLYALGLAFTAYAAAEAVGGSGFLAAFAAGLMVAINDVELCDCFLEYGEATAEMLLLLTFVALGTTLIWIGLGQIGWRTVVFAVVALFARAAVLYPVLGGGVLPERDRRLVSLFGARGLSSLLLVLLPVFAGLDGAERLFAIASFVVLLSVVLHGGAIAMFVRANRKPRDTAEPLQLVTPDAVPEIVSIAEVRELLGREDTVIIDARADRNYRADATIAAGAVRVDPEDPIRDATALRLSQRANLLVYCA